MEVIQPIDESQFVTFCLDDGIEINGIFYTVSGTFTQTITDINGCEAELILELTGQQCSDCDTGSGLTKNTITITKKDSKVFHIQLSDDSSIFLDTNITSNDVVDFVNLISILNSNRVLKQEEKHQLVQSFIQKDLSLIHI